MCGTTSPRSRRSPGCRIRRSRTCPMPRSALNALGPATLSAAVHGRRGDAAGPPHARAVSNWLRGEFDAGELIALYGRVSRGEGQFDALMRAAIWGALAARAGDGLQVGAGATFRNLERCEIGD